MESRVGHGARFPRSLQPELRPWSLAVAREVLVSVHDPFPPWHHTSRAALLMKLKLLYQKMGLIIPMRPYENISIRQYYIKYSNGLHTSISIYILYMYCILL